MNHLVEEHAEIREHCRVLLAALDSEVAPDASELAQLRLAISRTVNAHFVNEDSHLGRALWDPAGKNAAILSDWALKRQELRNLYSAHLRDWPLSDVLNNRAQYRAAVFERLKAGETMMRWEESEIYKLADSNPSR